tara:strand:- start:55 stop:582 length:528 start_codon:yes stop_codon:yes gene_type:complete
MITTSPLITKALGVIVGPHGALDLFHAIDNKNLDIYCFTNIATLGCTEYLWNINPHIILPIFLSMSAYHFRHQFDSLTEKLNIENSSLLLSSILVSTSFVKPEITYAFIALIHTPSQYMENHELINPERSLFLLALTGAALYFDNLFVTWMDNPFIISVILAHTFYQEFVVQNNN